MIVIDSLCNTEFRIRAVMSFIPTVIHLLQILQKNPVGSTLKYYFYSNPYNLLYLYYIKPSPQTLVVKIHRTRSCIEGFTVFCLVIKGKQQVAMVTLSGFQNHLL